MFRNIPYCLPLPDTVQMGLAIRLSPVHKMLLPAAAAILLCKMDARAVASAVATEHECRGWTRPEEWSNDDRMYFLMSPYPPGKVPSSEDAKFKFWSRLIHSSSCELCKITFSLNDVYERFERNSLRPKCLREVVQLMERQGSVVQLERYEQRVREQSDGLVSWSVGVLARPLSWAWRYVTNTGPSGVHSHWRFLIVDRLHVSVVVSATTHLVKLVLCCVSHCDRDWPHLY